MRLWGLGQEYPQPSIIIDASGGPGSFGAYAGIKVNVARPFDGSAYVLGDEEPVLMTDNPVLVSVINGKSGKEATAQRDISTVNGNGVSGHQRYASGSFRKGRAFSGKEGIGGVLEQDGIPESRVLFEIAANPPDRQVFQGNIFSADDVFFNALIGVLIGTVIRKEVQLAIGVFDKAGALYLHVINIHLVDSIGQLKP